MPDTAGQALPAAKSIRQLVSDVLLHRYLKEASINRMLVITLIAVVIVAVLVIVVLADGRPASPEAVLAMAENYARYLSFASPQTVTVQRIVRAAHAERFQQAMSKATYGDSVVYHHTYGLKQMAETGRPGLVPTYGGRPVPFPPTELWCVLLSDGSVVVVGQHLDMHNADWILHEVKDTNMRPVGCDMAGTN